MHFRSNDISEEELGAAFTASVNSLEEEEISFESDVQSWYTSDMEVLGLRGINYYMSALGEEEVVEDTWRHLSLIKKLLVFDILLGLDFEANAIALEKCKEAVGKITDIVEGVIEEEEESEDNFAVSTDYA